MVLPSKEDLVMVKVVEVVAMVVLVDMELEVGDMVVVKVFTVVAGGMEVMMDIDGGRYGGSGGEGRGGGRCYKYG
ncbi:hypothetical protein R3W88_001010 [Solanum pinnatisectum]|uniref:Uncharacterized protein n=1 Tax=Solanum pinnatisectum TaxID=50273 RepID=A0AAV9MHJ2_9SOLN|nr:hypothetical protein R3W88_001010 [Solanum pinnatisectum]